MIILFWLFFSIAVGAFASSKGQSFFLFTILSLFLSPLIGFIVALISENRIENNTPDKQFYRWLHAKCNGNYETAANMLGFDTDEKVSYSQLFTAWQELKANLV